MRSTRDRLRQAIGLELLALLLLAPLGPLIGIHMMDFGTVALASSLAAMGWAYVFNLCFDHAARHLRGTAVKTPGLRLLHAALFEVTLTALMVPIVAWFLDLGLLQALALDLSLAAFYFGLTLVYTWAYDRAFPLPRAAVPEPRSGGA